MTWYDQLLQIMMFNTNLLAYLYLYHLKLESDNLYHVRLRIRPRIR